MRKLKYRKGHGRRSVHPRASGFRCPSCNWKRTICE
jgi:hypothetical protein